MKEVLVGAAVKLRALLRSERGDGVVGYVLILAFIAAVAASVFPETKRVIGVMATEANSAIWAVLPR